MEKFITPSQAYELSRLPHDMQHVLYEKIRAGKADSYNKPRPLANALLVPPATQTFFGPPPSESDIGIGIKYDMMVEKLLGFISRSFDKEDLSILNRVVSSSVSVNIQKLDLIITELNKIKKALIHAESAREVSGVASKGETLCCTQSGTSG